MMPNVDNTVEMVDAMAASRSYSANIAAFEAVKAIAVKALEIGK
jgi:flagellar basal-body rod protein FlgC